MKDSKENNGTKDSKENRNNKYATAIGIDLGTTMSCVGIYDNETETVKIIENELGSKTTPSVVAFLDNTIIVGEEAKNSIHLYPYSTCKEIKRFMGKRINDIGIDEDIANMNYEISSDNNGKIVANMQLYDTMKDTHTIKSFHPAEISAMILRKMKDIAQNYLGYEVRDAVITVPAYFNDAQRSDTYNAGIIAGLNPLRIINEPTAASLCYGFDNKSGTILVFDLGGGTFDVSILEINSGVFEVLAVNGNCRLGGLDFDNRLVQYFIKSWNEKFPSDNMEENYENLSKLKEMAEKCKKTLSSKLVERVTMEFNNKRHQVNISRKLFEDLCNDLFQSCKEPIIQALKDADLTSSEIDEIVLVGGSTRIPKICKILEELFDGKQLNRSVNPDEAVAYGASIQGAILTSSDKGKNNKTKDIVLSDIIPLSLGIKTGGNKGIMTKIINKNTSIPHTAHQNFSTIEDNQETVSIEIYEGEREFTKDNHLLGRFELTGIQKAMKGVPKIDVTFHIDENGILNVKAIDMKTLRSAEIKISNDTGLSQDDIKRMLNDADKYRMRDAVEREAVEFSFQFHDYLDLVLRDLNGENNIVLSSLEISSLNQLIMNNKVWLDEGNHSLDELQLCRDNIKMHIDPIMNKIYSRIISNEDKEMDNNKNNNTFDPNTLTSDDLNKLVNSFLK